MKPNQSEWIDRNVNDTIDVDSTVHKIQTIKCIGGKKVSNSDSECFIWLWGLHEHIQPAKLYKR